MRIFFAAALLLSVVGCDPPKEEDPPTEEGDPCGDDRCDKGFACVNTAVGEDENDDGVCKTLPDDCDGCDCETGDLCPDDSFGDLCVSFGSRVSVTCQLPAAEGEGEGEGE